MTRLPRAVPLTVIPFLLLTPSVALAQWYGAGYVGASHTQNATVSVRVPDEGLALDFHDVRF